MRTIIRIGWLRLLSVSVGLVLTPNLFTRSQSLPPSQPPAKVAVSYGLIVDNSGSLRSLLEYVVATSKLIVSHNESSDETFIVRFIDRQHIQRIQDLTPNKEALNDAIDSFYVEGGQTAILDALYESAQYLAQNSQTDDPARRRALILITDGEDRENRKTLENVLEITREKKIQVYVIGLITELEKDKGKKLSDKAVIFLTNLANETGGKAYIPKNPHELNNNAGEILNIIRTR